MRAVNMPRLTAGVSLYRSTNQYRGATQGHLRDGVSPGVSPQGCGFVKGAVCAGFIAGGSGLCTITCLTGEPLLCGGCWVTALGAVYSSCKECIPAWMRALVDAFESGGSSGGSGGGGGGPVRDPKRCCERNEFGRCILSVPRNEPCPGDDL
jgi:hypothetical protein